MLRSNKLLAIVMAISATGIWGLEGVIGKFLVGTTNPMVVILTQLGFSTLISWIIVIIKFEYLEFDRNRLLGSLLGILHPGLSSSLGIIGLSYVGASVSSLVWALEAVMTMILAWVLRSEKISRSQILLSIVSFAGVILASSSIDPILATREQCFGVISLLGAVLCVGAYSVLSQHFMANIESNSLVLVTCQQTIGLFWMVLMLPLSLHGNQFMEFPILSHSVLVACVLAGLMKYLVATGLFVRSLRHLSATFASSFLVLTPVFGISAAVAFLGERLSQMQWVGVVLVLLAVISMQFTNRSQET